jgi:hypothetical protein
MGFVAVTGCGGGVIAAAPAVEQIGSGGQVLS